VFFCVSIRQASAQSKPLPPGPMQPKVKAACTQCHNASRITKQHLTRKAWSAQLDKMVGLGAEIPDSERTAFLNYLSKNFGPDKNVKSAEKNSGDDAK
jgi:quinoprotein glucose dehydrogenase